MPLSLTSTPSFHHTLEMADNIDLEGRLLVDHISEYQEETNPDFDRIKAQYGGELPNSVASPFITEKADTIDTIPSLLN